MKSHKKLSNIVPLENNANKKYKVGYTTGVYDLFHIGHLNILRRSKNMCETLIVGVTSDDLVLYKNKKPIIPWEERKEIVGAINCVDKVIEQKTMDKLDAAIKLGANVIFVGDDWKGTEKWNKIEEELKVHNIDVVYFPYTVDASTTLINEIIKNQK